MSEMEKLYFVEVNDSKEDIIAETSLELLARALGISEQGVNKLLARVPGAVTKAIPKPQAKKIAENFAKAGISTKVQEFGKTSPSKTPTTISNVKPKTTSTSATAVKVKTETITETKPKAIPETKETPVSIDKAVAEKASQTDSKDQAIEIRAEERKETITDSVKSSSITELNSADLYKPIFKTKLWRKIFSISSTTALLLFFANMAIFWFAIRPILQEQLIMARLEPSLVSSASLSDNVAVKNDSLIVSPQLLTQLVKTIDTKSIDFLVISDLNAKTVTNWHPNFAIDNNLEQEILKQAQLAVKGNTGIYKQNETGLLQKIISPNAISIAYQPLLKDSQIVGATILGIANTSINNLLNRIFLLWLVLSLIPLALSYLISALGSHKIAKNMITIGRSADEISRGNLSTEIEPQSNDELQHISNALERLRVSMSEALIRLRRRR